MEVELEAAQHPPNFVRANPRLDRARPRRKQGGDSRAYHRKPVGVERAIDSIQPPDFAEELLGGDDVDEDDAGIDTRDVARKDRGDVERYRAVAAQAGEHRARVRRVAPGDTGRDDRAARRDQRIRVATHLGSERLVAGDRTQQIDAENVQNLARERLPRLVPDRELVLDRRCRIVDARSAANPRQ